MVLLAGVFLSLPGVAHAYIDPGYGALVWQAIVAAMVSVVFFFRHTIKGFFSQKLGRGRSAPDGEESEADGDEH